MKIATQALSCGTRDPQPLNQRTSQPQAVPWTGPAVEVEGRTPVEAPASLDLRTPRHGENPVEILGSCDDLWCDDA